MTVGTMAEAERVSMRPETPDPYSIEWARRQIAGGAHGVRSLTAALGLKSHATLSMLLADWNHASVGPKTRRKIEHLLKTHIERVELSSVMDDPMIAEMPHADGDAVAWWKNVAMGKWGYTLDDIAREVGYHSTVVSKVLGGKYDGSEENVEMRFGHARSRVLGLSQGCFVTTEVYRWIEDTLNASYGHPLMTIIVGDAGIGKTESLKRYQLLSRVRDRRVLLITLDRNATTRTTCERILTGLGGTPHGQAAVMVERIVEELRREPRLLVFDEANTLSTGSPRTAAKLIDTLRTINDRAGCGLVMVGTHGFLNLIYAPSRRDEMEMLLSRIGVEVQLRTPGEAEIRSFVRAFFPGMSEAAWTTFWHGLNNKQSNRTKNSFRRAASWLRHAREILARNAGAEMSSEVARLAWSRMLRA